MNLVAAYASAIFCALAIQAVSRYRLRMPATLPAE
jgi:hypothetical protein